MLCAAGLPFSMAGLYFHFLTAFTADLVMSVLPEVSVTNILFTLPTLSITMLNLAHPSRPYLAAFSGVFASARSIGSGSTIPKLLEDTRLNWNNKKRRL